MAIEGYPVWWIEAGAEAAPEFHQATLDWVRSLGLDPARLAPQAAVVLWDGAYELHVDEVVRDERSSSPATDRADPMNEDNLLTVRRIVPVEADSWPAMPLTADGWPTYKVRAA